MATCPSANSTRLTPRTRGGGHLELSGVRQEPRPVGRRRTRIRRRRRLTTTTTTMTTRTRKTKTTTRMTTIDDEDERRRRRVSEDARRVSRRQRRAGRKRAAPPRHCSPAFDSVIVAFSGGVDSAYLAWAATQVLGPARALHHRRQPQLSRSSSPARAAHRARVRPAPRDHPHRRARSARVPRQPGQPLLLLQARALHRADAASRARAASPSIADGSNADDRGDYRPGRQAAREFGVRSPLDEAGPDQGGDPRAVARAPACPRGTSRRRRVCRRAFRTTPKSPTRSCG